MLKRLKEVESQLAEAQAKKTPNIDVDDATVILAWTPEQVAMRNEKLDEFFEGPVLKEFKDTQRHALDVTSLREKFSELDVDGDGLITMQQLVEFLVENGLDESNAKRHVQGFYRMVKFDTTENISFEEFCSELDRMQNYILMRSIQTSFQKCDKDKNNRLDQEEFIELLTLHYGSKQHAIRKVGELFHEIDTDKNGSLSLREVAEWYFTTEVAKTYERKMQAELSHNEQRLLEEQKLIQLALEEAKGVAARMDNAFEDEAARQKQAMAERLARRKEARREAKVTLEAQEHPQLPVVEAELGELAISPPGNEG